MNLKKVTLLALIAMLFVNCTSKKQKEVSDEIVLKIGSFEITKYEFEKSKTEYENSKKNDKSLSINKWLKDYTDGAYLLADAYDKKFDTAISINKIAMYEFDSRLASQNGYVWNKIVAPTLTVSKSEIKNAYKKREQVYYLEILCFPYDSLWNNSKKLTTIKNEIEFQQLKTECEIDKTATTFSMSECWPFRFPAPYNDQIYNSDIGGIIGPFYMLNSYYLIHITHKEKIRQRPFAKEKDEIEGLLWEAKINEVISNSQKNIYNKTNIVINETILNNLIDNLKKNNQNGQKRLNVNKDLYDNILMTYSLNGSKKNYKASQFADYIQYSTLYGDYTDKSTIELHLRNHVVREYYYRVADSLGILKDKQYILDKKSFKNNLMEYYYYVNEFQKNILVDDQEILKYYEENKESFTDGKTVTVSFLTFKDKHSADENIGAIAQLISQDLFFKLKDTTLLKGLISYQPNIKIDFTNKDYPAEVISDIFSIPEKQVSMPYEFHGTYLMFFVTKREGVRVKELNEVKEAIRQILISRKMEDLKNKRIEELRNKYIITTNKLL
jgi:peptidyl-prolyl cis-trans isomerase C